MQTQEAKSSREIFRHRTDIIRTSEFKPSMACVSAAIMWLIISKIFASFVVDARRPVDEIAHRSSTHSVRICNDAASKADSSICKYSGAIPARGNMLMSKKTKIIIYIYGSKHF